MKGIYPGFRGAGETLAIKGYSLDFSGSQGLARAEIAAIVVS